MMSVVTKSHAETRSLAEAFQAEVLVMRDDYAFGMETQPKAGTVPGQVYVEAKYRYGFNGIGVKKRVETASDVKGTGDSYDFGARMYDRRVGRWWSKDPMEGKYPAFATYSFVGNWVVTSNDPNGREIWLCQSGKKYRYEGGNLYDTKGAHVSVESIDMAGIADTYSQLNQLKSDDVFANSVISYLEAHDKKLEITSFEGLPGKGNGNNYVDQSEFAPYGMADVGISYYPDAGQIQQDPEDALIEGPWNVRSPRVGLADELWGAYEIMSGNYFKEAGVVDDKSKEVVYPDGAMIPTTNLVKDNIPKASTIHIREIRAVNFSNRIRLKTGDARREGYGGRVVLSQYLDYQEDLQKDKVVGPENFDR